MQNERHAMSIDSNVYIYTGPWIKRLSRALVIVMITFILLMPVIVFNFVDTITSRILVTIISTIVYLLVLSEFTKSRTQDLILAGST